MAVAHGFVLLRMHKNHKKLPWTKHSRSQKLCQFLCIG